jgi:curved DNA-binding protein CbpA
MNPYKTLGLPNHASLADVKSAYRKLAMQYHPDRNPDGSSLARFQEINAAYDMLKDESKKADTDRTLQENEIPRQTAQRHERRDRVWSFDPFADLATMYEQSQTNGAHWTGTPQAQAARAQAEADLRSAKIKEAISRQEALNAKRLARRARMEALRVQVEPLIREYEALEREEEMDAFVNSQEHQEYYTFYPNHKGTPR